MPVLKELQGDVKGLLIDLCEGGAASELYGGSLAHGNGNVWLAKKLNLE